MKWIRLWTDYIINGTTFSELDCETRGVWFSLLALAGYSPVAGTICISKGIPYTDEQMSGFLKIPLPILIKALKILTSPEINKLTVNQDGTLTVTNWAKYQTEYDRQKPYRRGLQGKVTKKVTPESYEQTLRVDTEVEVEVRREKKKERKACVLDDTKYEHLKDPAFLELWNSFLEARENMKAKATDNAKQLLLKKLQGWPLAEAIASLSASIENGWRGVFEVRKNQQQKQDKEVDAIWARN